MTPDEQELDIQSVSLDSLIVYRLVRTKYANLDGVGSALFPGRWNQPAEKAIYTSTERGVPLLEKLVHTPKSRIAKNLSMMTIRISGNWRAANLRLLDPATGGAFHRYSSLSRARLQFVLEQAGREPRRYFAVALPSVIVPVWNVVLYPDAPGFWQHVTVEQVEPFELDPRLFPEGTPEEAL